jgi:hypothetical protein
MTAPVIATIAVSDSSFVVAASAKEEPRDRARSRAPSDADADADAAAGEKTGTEMDRPVT